MAQSNILVRNIAVKLAAKIIIVNAISLGIVETNTLKHCLSITNNNVFKMRVSRPEWKDVDT